MLPAEHSPLTGGSGGPRAVQASIVNLGAININTSLPLGRSDGGLVNQGSVTVAGGQTLTVWGQYSQTAGLTTINGALTTTNIVANQGGAFAGSGVIYGNYQQSGGGALNVTLDSPGALAPRCVRSGRHRGQASRHTGQRVCADQRRPRSPSSMPAC